MYELHVEEIEIDSEREMRDESQWRGPRLNSEFSPFNAFASCICSSAHRQVLSSLFQLWRFSISLFNIMDYYVLLFECFIIKLLCVRRTSIHRIRSIESGTEHKNHWWFFPSILWRPLWERLKHQISCNETNKAIEWRTALPFNESEK